MQDRPTIHFVTRLAFLQFILGCVRLLLKLGVCCKSLIRKYFPTERRTVNPQVPGSSPGRGAKSISALCATPVSVSTRDVPKNAPRKSVGRCRCTAYRRTFMNLESDYCPHSLSSLCPAGANEGSHKVPPSDEGWWQRVPG